MFLSFKQEAIFSAVFVYAVDIELGFTFTMNMHLHYGDVIVKVGLLKEEEQKHILVASVYKSERNH